MREEGVIRSQAVLLAIDIGWDGRRSILAVELANRESRSSWRDFLLGLRERGLSGIEFVVSDDHAGLRQAIVEVLPEAAWQRCRACPRAGLWPDPGVHFLRNALDYVPRKVDDDCLRELRWLEACPPGGLRPTRGIVVIWAKLGATWRPGSPNGRRPTPSCAAGSKSTSRRR